MASERTVFHYYNMTHRGTVLSELSGQLENDMNNSRLQTLHLWNMADSRIAIEPQSKWIARPLAASIHNAHANRMLLALISNYILLIFCVA